MKKENIKPILKNILAKIHRLDLAYYPEQKGQTRFYSYLTSIKRELVKITVAVKNYRKSWYCKQVAAHGVRSDECLVKDMEYQYRGMGYRVGWHAEGASKHKKFFEDGKWYEAAFKYYNPSYTVMINPEYIGRFSRYKYSAYSYFKGDCLIRYLKLYEKYPQAEYLLKLGLHGLYNKVTVLKKMAKDKKFCKWLARNRIEITECRSYVESVMRAYRTGEPLKQVQAFLESKERLENSDNYRPLRELFRKDLERFFSYLEEQQSSPSSYLDYLRACNYLGLDMTLSKNRYPHNFKHWHDIRVDQYHTARAAADEREREELFNRFAAVAAKYTGLQHTKSKCGYAVIIAASPAELVQEGESLYHCVGKMNYDQKVAREESLIFFVRDCSNLDVPKYTIEYSLESKRVLQCYGYKHAPPDEVVLNYVNKVWLPYANRTVRKVRATHCDHSTISA